MIIKKRLKYFILAVLCFIFTIISTTSYVPQATAETYRPINLESSVIDDLKRADNFFIDNFEKKVDDYSLEVITLCEGEDDNVYVYVYQPSANKDILATNINISKTIGDELNFNKYNLELCGSYEVFFKYAIKYIDKEEYLKVEDKKIRNYYISTIFRKFDSSLGDKETENDNTINGLGFPVAKNYEVSGSGKTLFVNYNEVDFIEIESKYVGFCRYPADTVFSPFQSLDVHFIAFSTNIKMDSILEIQLDYYLSDFSIVTPIGGQSDKPTYLLGESTYENVVIDCAKDLEYNNDNQWWAYSLWGNADYSWPYIQSGKDFVNPEKHKYFGDYSLFQTSVDSYITEGSKSEIENKDWVIRFDKTIYNFTNDSIPLVKPAENYITQFSIVSKVNLLRFKFVKDGETYNLGVVDNIQTGGSNPSNVTEVITELKEEIKVILAIVLLLAFIVICFPLIKLLFKVIFVVLKFIFFDVLLAPIRWLLGLFER